MPPCLPLEIIFPKFVRTYGTCMHHDNYHSNNYIVPPLINFLLGYVNLIHYAFVSREFPVDVWNFCSALESLVLCGVTGTTPLSLE